MTKNLDVLGFELTEAIMILEKNNIGFIVKESFGKEKLEGVKRVIGQKIIADNKIELIISCF
ncbi:hypothetical protein [Serpentinicella alkaliphila]|uniref:PASTA domain-containing protein n=1 Tax=Serpentinicella alkaliphila TaxID=1734049 RepID=A0A4R2TSK4_9FIRM|nr:hypothetical protein [Serpentinicella alkaliphila]QUH26316.1 hypothetical protein HZR23_11625 [Serpentinicella alkaliphila]TCQ05896.1 hypothetical protein EDD79_100477 [Serpentinicella alkaliphila]